MKKFLMALAVLAVASAPALAGPNAGGTLVVHDTGLEFTDTNSDYPSEAPTCAGVDNSIDAGAFRAWKVYAAFPEASSPRLKALSWGIVSGAQVYVGGGGLPHPLTDFAITQGDWAAGTGSIGQSFMDVQTSTLVECYWFGGYGYAGSFATVPHAVQTSVFVDDGTPAQEDAIAGFSSLGFGEAGMTECPAAPVAGACCFADGSCQMLLADACLAAGGTFNGGDCTPSLCPPPPATGACCIQTACEVLTETACLALGGQYQGNDVPCTPTLCAPIPTENTSWGQIKANYR